MAQFIRPVSLDDVEAITELRRTHREFLAPWEPARPADFLEIEHQRGLVERALEEQAAGRQATFVILAPDGQVAGMANLNNIVRGALQSASLGYWVGEHLTRRGLASGAAREALAHAFDVLDLHRVEACTLLHNAASQQVLRNAGFRPFGVAPRFLRIAGRWQDHLLFHAFATESDD